jgi:hypothetical protein
MSGVAELVRDTERPTAVTLLQRNPGSDWCIWGVNAYLQFFFADIPGKVGGLRLMGVAASVL